MRNGQHQHHNKRMRGRNNNNNSNNNNNNNRRNHNPLTRVYESNGPDVKIRRHSQPCIEEISSACARCTFVRRSRSRPKTTFSTRHLARLIAVARGQSGRTRTSSHEASRAGATTAAVPPRRGREFRRGRRRRPALRRGAVRQERPAALYPADRTTICAARQPELSAARKPTP